MNVLSQVRKNEMKFRSIIREFQEDVKKTGATSITEVDWNPDSEVFFYSLIGPKAKVSRSFKDVKLSVFTKVISKLNLEISKKQ